MTLRELADRLATLAERFNGRSGAYLRTLAATLLGGCGEKTLHTARARWLLHFAARNARVLSTDGLETVTAAARVLHGWGTR